MPVCVRASIVSEKEANSRQLQEVVVNGFKLVRQWVYAGNRKPEVGVEFVGDAEGIRLNADLENMSVAFVCEMRPLYLKLLEVG